MGARRDGVREGSPMMRHASLRRDGRGRSVRDSRRESARRALSLLCLPLLIF